MNKIEDFNPKAQEQIRKQLNERPHIQNRSAVPDEVAQPAILNESLAADAGEARHTGRHLVRIKTCRVRILDADNAMGGAKPWVDALRYCKLIRDDNPACIEIEVKQEKVGSAQEEKVIIEIIPI